MTNYRISCAKGEFGMFAYCFTCGAKLVFVKKNDADYKTCEDCSVHLKVWAENEDDEEVKFM